MEGHPRSYGTCAVVRLGMIDMQGRTAAFTGKDNGAFAGSRQDRNYTVQGNILVGREVIDAAANATTWWS